MDEWYPLCASLSSAEAKSMTSQPLSWAVFWIKCGAKCETPINQFNALIYEMYQMGSWVHGCSMEIFQLPTNLTWLKQTETQRIDPWNEDQFLFFRSALKLHLNCLNNEPMLPRCTSAIFPSEMPRFMRGTWLCGNGMCSQWLSDGWIAMLFFP